MSPQTICLPGLFSIFKFDKLQFILYDINQLKLELVLCLGGKL